MLASLIIVFREVLEAGLIVGIVLAATEGVVGRAAWLAGGIAAGGAGSLVVAAFAGSLANAFAGAGQELFNASILIAATLMLAWHQLWMASHGRQLAGEMRAIGRDVALGRRSLFAMALVVAVAVLREGSEVVLFLYGIAATGQDGAPALLLGAAAGLAIGAAVSYALYRGLLAIPVGRLFAVTGALIALLAAGMAGQAAATLAGADLIPAWGYQLWDTSWLLPQDSLLGKTLHALVGYADRPMGVQLAAWAAVLLTLLVGARLLARKPQQVAVAALLALSLVASPRAEAREYFVGGPVHQHDMEIVANYLIGIEMAPMPADMAMGPDVIHLEADVHATADNIYGFPDGAWVPYLKIDYTVEKTGTPWKANGTLLAMQAKDGPHYAANLKMDGPGTYRVTYKFTSPESQGYLRHTDKETGIPAWWSPFTQDFTFKYPQ